MVETSERTPVLPPQPTRALRLAERTLPAAVPREHARRWLRIMALVILWGIVVRAGQFLSRQSFRADEAALLLNIVEKRTGELFTTHLSYAQAAPPLFL